MSAVSRVTLPGEFYDRTTDILLTQPEPQYLYADLFLGALGMSTMAIQGGAFGLRSISGQGADYSAFTRDQLMMSSPMYTDLIAAKVDFNGAPGNTIRINRPAYATSTFTEASRKIPIGGSISTTPIAVNSEQTNLTLYRYGGPYDQTNSRVAPIAIEAFDANMGVHNLVKVAKNTLVRDCHRWIDAVMVTLADLASTSVYPEGMTADNDATAKGTFPFTFEQLSRAERKADDANLPTFADGFRVLVLTPTQSEQLGLDPLYSRSAKYFPQYNSLFPQYVASVKKLHIFKSTTLTTTSNSSSVAIHKGHLLAPGAFLAGMGRPLRLATSTDDNYGETGKVVWLGDLAFGIADNRFSISVRSAEDAA